MSFKSRNCVLIDVPLGSVDAMSSASANSRSFFDISNTSSMKGIVISQELSLSKLNLLIFYFFDNLSQTEILHLVKCLILGGITEFYLPLFIILYSESKATFWKSDLFPSSD
jgi:hypothetical protein